MHSYLMQHLCVIVEELVTISESKVAHLLCINFLVKDYMCLLKYASRACNNINIHANVCV